MPKIDEAKIPVKKTAANSPPKKGMEKAKGFKPISFGEREVLYPEVSVNKAYGEHALTFEVVKKLLGWSESPNPELPNEPYLFKDINDKPIWCHNVITKTYRNRFITWSNVLALKQEILRGHWKRNGESLIIGKSAFVLNGQHQMIAFCLAVQEWNLYQEDWSDVWPTEPTLEKLVVFGIEEDDATVNSMDTAKPRSLVEVIERSEVFASMKNAERKECAKITDHAVRLLWHRLGVKLDAFAPRRTHSEAMDFIGHHPKLLECVKHIFEENSEQKIVDVITPGYAAALMYLMATSSSDPLKYHDADIFSEANANLENYDKAADFFVLISGEAKEMAAIREYTLSLKIDGLDTRDAKMALLCKAWTLFIQEATIDIDGLRLDFSSGDSDVRKLAECPTTGGIDRGNPKDDLGEDEEPTEEEIAEHKAAEEAIRQERLKGKATGGKGLKAGKSSKKIELGDHVWVSEDGGKWDGELVEIYDANGKPVGKVKSTATGKSFDAPLEMISLTEPA